MASYFRPLLFLLCGVFCLSSLTSCSSMSRVAQNVKNVKVPKPSLKLPKWKKPDFSKLAVLNPKNFSWKDLRKKKERIPVVAVDDKKLKKQQNGEQLYLAYNDKKKKYGYTNESGTMFQPVDPDLLPKGEGGAIPTTGLLPALDPNGGYDNSLPAFSVDDLPDVILPGEPGDVVADLEKDGEEVVKPGPPRSKPVSPEASPAPAFLEFNPPELE